jgi:hypothetical protein
VPGQPGDAPIKDRQDSKMPIFYFTELIGLAFGLDQTRSWLKKHLINPLPEIWKRTGSGALSDINNYYSLYG